MPRHLKRFCISLILAFSLTGCAGGISFDNSTNYVETKPPANSDNSTNELQRFLDPTYTEDGWHRLNRVELEKYIRGNAFAVGAATSQLQFHSDGTYASWDHRRPVYKGAWRTYDDQIVTSTQRNFIVVRNVTNETFFIPTKGTIGGLAGPATPLKTSARDRFPASTQAGKLDGIYAVTEMPQTPLQACAGYAWAGIVQVYNDKAYLTKSDGIDFIPVQVGSIDEKDNVIIGLNGDKARVPKKFHKLPNGDQTASTMRGPCDITITATQIDNVLRYYAAFEHNVRQSPPPVLIASELTVAKTNSLLENKVLVYDFAQNHSNSPLLRYFKTDGTNFLKTEYGNTVRQKWAAKTIERIASGNTTIVTFGHSNNGLVPHFDHKTGIFRMSAMYNGYPYQSLWVGILADCWPDTNAPDRIPECDAQATKATLDKYKNALRLYPFDR